jgi:hypothetical protein
MAQPTIRGNFVKWNASAGHFVAEIAPTRLGEQPQRLTAVNGSVVVFDSGYLFDARVVFKPRFLEVVVPMGLGPPQIPPSQENLDWQIATKVQLLFDGPLGLRVATITSEIALNSLASLWLQLSFKAEIQRGLIAVCRIHEAPAVRTDFGVYYGPLLEPIDFITRDDPTFGPRFTSAPLPTLASTAQQPQLTSSVAAEVKATPEPESAPTTSDMFARFRPIPSKGPPY